MTIKNEKVERLSSDELHLSWESSSPVTVYQIASSEVDSKKIKKIETKNDNQVMVQCSNAYRPYFLIETVTTQKVVAERVILLEGAYNFRDLGGYMTKIGKQVKWGKLYRSDHLNKLTDLDMKKLQSLGIRSIVDYRTEQEYTQQPNRLWSKDLLTHHLIPEAETAELAAKTDNDKDKINELIKIAKQDLSENVIDDSGRLMIDQNKNFVSNPQVIKVYRELIDLVLDQKNIPMDQHCRGGKDRTGYGAGLLLYLLGVDKEDILADYEMTEKLRATRNQKRMAQYKRETTNPQVLGFLLSMMQARKEYLNVAFLSMERQSGSVDRYIEEVLGVTQETIDRLQSEFLY